MIQVPQFPLTVRWLSTGEVESFQNLTAIEQNIENIDTANGEVDVRDSSGRKIHLRIFLLRTEVFALSVGDELPP